jgi:hypothetical protein
MAQVVQIRVTEVLKQLLVEVAEVAELLGNLVLALDLAGLQVPVVHMAVVAAAILPMEHLRLVQVAQSALFGQVLLVNSQVHV